LIVAIVLLAALVIGLVVAGVVATRQSSIGASTPQPTPAPQTGPVPLVPVDAPQAGSPSCGTLLSRLPAALPDAHSTLPRRPIAAPAPPAAAAWGDSANPVVLRCGLAAPPEFTATSEVLGVDSVSWFQVSGPDSVTWYTVDRPVTVALTLPSVVTGTGPIQTVSAVIAAAMPGVGVHPAG
jgi:hypothetical protein